MPLITLPPATAPPSITSSDVDGNLVFTGVAAVTIPSGTPCGLTGTGQITPLVSSPAFPMPCLGWTVQSCVAGDTISLYSNIEISYETPTPLANGVLLWGSHTTAGSLDDFPQSGSPAIALVLKGNFNINQNEVTNLGNFRKTIYCLTRL